MVERAAAVYEADMGGNTDFQSNVPILMPDYPLKPYINPAPKSELSKAISIVIEVELRSGTCKYQEIC
ncbi:MAG: hypothetical protein LBU32_12800 [Clostridiales bacterium]|nr:hypothetical protein [Clostridiales bacterium]